MNKVTIIYYSAKDGRRFDTEKECRDYEKTLKQCQKCKEWIAPGKLCEWCNNPRGPW